MKLHVLSSGSSGNGYILEGRRSALLIECGVRPEDMFRMTDVPVSKLVGALVSHEHGDHAKYVARYAALGIPIYASAGTISGFGKLHEAAHVRRINAMSTFPIEDFKVSAFDVQHDAAEPLGFIIEHPECGKVLFMTDTEYCMYNFRSLALDHIMVEANYDNGILNANVASGLIEPSRAIRTRKAHFSIRQACDFIRACMTAELKTVVLLHLSQDNANAASFARMAEETALFAHIYVAVGGITIQLNKNEICPVL